MKSTSFFLLDAAGCVLYARPLVLIIRTFSFFLSVEHNVKGWEADHSVCAHRQTLAPLCDKPVRSERCSRHRGSSAFCIPCKVTLAAASEMLEPESAAASDI